VSAPLGHPSLRARISETLDAHLLNVSARELGAKLGHAGTTINRRGGDLRQWPADELLHLAATVPEINEAVREYLTGSDVTGDARRVDSDLMDGLAALGMTIAHMAEAMRDRHCDVREAARLLPLVQQAQAQLAQAAKDLAEQVRRGAA
jgi:hypothetical protein